MFLCDDINAIKLAERSQLPGVIAIKYNLVHPLYITYVIYLVDGHLNIRATASRLRDTWTTYRQADGLAIDHTNAVAIDSNGRAWFGSESYGDRGYGVSRFDGTDWRVYTTADGLASNRVMSVAVDEEGHLWFGTTGGVSVFTPAFGIYLPLVLRQ